MDVSVLLKILMGVFSVAVVVVGIREGTWDKTRHRPTKHGYLVIVLGIALFALGSAETVVSHRESEREKQHALQIQEAGFQLTVEKQEAGFKSTQARQDATIEHLRVGFADLQQQNSKLVDLLHVSNTTVKDRFALSGLKGFTIDITNGSSNGFGQTLVFRFDTGFEIWVVGDKVELHTRDSIGYCVVETEREGIPFNIRTFDAIYSKDGGFIEIPNLETRDNKPYIIFESELVNEDEYEKVLDTEDEGLYKTDIVRVSRIEIVAHIDNLDLMNAKEIHFDRTDKYLQTQSVEVILIDGQKANEKPSISITMDGLGTAKVQPEDFQSFGWKCGEHSLAKGVFE